MSLNHRKINSYWSSYGLNLRILAAASTYSVPGNVVDLVVRVDNVVAVGEGGVGVAEVVGAVAAAPVAVAPAVDVTAAAVAVVVSVPAGHWRISCPRIADHVGRIPKAKESIRDGLDI